MKPTRTPRNANPLIPGDHPRCCWNTMGKAPKSIYWISASILAYGLMTHVKSGVDDGEVEREQEDNRLLEQQDPRSTESGLEELADFHLLVLLKLASVNSTSRLAKGFGTLSKKDRGVCLGDEESSDDSQDSSEDCKKSCNPSPPSSFT